MRMRPMSLFELGISSGEVSLGRTLRSVPVAAGAPDVTVPELIEIMCRGGWPGILDADLRQALQFSRDYLDEVRRTEVYRLAGIRRDPNRLFRLMRSLARHVATPVPVTTLSRDTGGPEGPLRGDTVSAYLDALERLFVVEDQPAYSTHLRARSRLRLSPKRHFVDPSLAVAALRSNPARLLADLEMFGFLFESLAVRDLRKYAQANDAEVYHYRDNTGLEADAIIETGDGRWMAIEVKLGTGNPIRRGSREPAETTGPDRYLQDRRACCSDGCHRERLRLHETGRGGCGAGDRPRTVNPVTRDVLYSGERCGPLYTPGLHPVLWLVRERVNLVGRYGGVVKPGVHAGLSSRRSRVQIPSSPPREPATPQPVLVTQRPGSSVGRALL